MSLNNINNKKWFVLYTKPMHELKVEENLINLGIESICPTILTNRIWSDRVKKVKEVLIKSIVFVKCSDNERNTVFNIPSTLKYLFYCNKPAVVTDHEIEHLKKLNKDKYILNKNLSIGDTIFLDKINQEGYVNNKSQNKTWINLKNINIRICI